MWCRFLQPSAVFEYDYAYTFLIHFWLTTNTVLQKFLYSLTCLLSEHVHIHGFWAQTLILSVHHKCGKLQVLQVSIEFWVHTTAFIKHNNLKHLTHNDSNCHSYEGRVTSCNPVPACFTVTHIHYPLFSTFSHLHGSEEASFDNSQWLRRENTLSWICFRTRILYLSRRSGSLRFMQSSCSSVIVP